MRPRARRVRGCHCEQDRQRAGGRRGQPRGLCLPLCAAHLPALERGLRRRRPPSAPSRSSPTSRSARASASTTARQRRARHPVRVGHRSSSWACPSRTTPPATTSTSTSSPAARDSATTARSITTVIFAVFTCIFFALEGAIMAQGLQVASGMPLSARLPHLHRGGDPDRDLRHACAGAPAVLDHARCGSRSRCCRCSGSSSPTPRRCAPSSSFTGELRRLDQLRRRSSRAPPCASRSPRSWRSRSTCIRAMPPRTPSNRPLVVGVARCSPARAGSSSAAPSR